MLPAASDDGALLDVERRRDDGSEDGGFPRRESVDVEAARRWSGFVAAPGPAVDRGGLPRCLLARSEVAAGRAVDSGVEVGAADAAGWTGANAGPFGIPLRCIARLAREVGSFGGAVESTGLVILSVIRAMGTELMPVAVIAHIIAGQWRGVARTRHVSRSAKVKWPRLNVLGEATRQSAAYARANLCAGDQPNGRLHTV